MEITLDRLKHSLVVAEKMKKLAMENSDRYPVNPDDMFILGMIHDIGYRFSNIQNEHAQKGGELLKRQGYRYWREVYYHGIPQTEYDSRELRLLNYVDMITGPSGENMTLQERIDDISARYGKDSCQVKDAVALLNMYCLEDDH